MKKFLSIMAVLGLIVGSSADVSASAPAVAPPAPGAAAGPSKGLMAAQAALPIVTMVAQQTASTVGTAVTEAVASLGGKSTRCNICNAIGCKALKATFDLCKSMCQEKVNVAGFEIKVRFADRWSIYECVKAGNNKYKNTETKAGSPQKMDSLTSIAVYSQYDLNYVSDILSKLLAAGTIIARGGYVSGINDGNRADAIEQSHDAQSILTTNLQQRAYYGYLGPQ